ncbi:Glutamine amidotransferase subunit pdxT [Rhynchospora pubera]|uniref:Glutamine amidotransferase subunit pdxT n=1 Tax=Rhynchospora pubera TaxID=906938 RepID=A0AAV8DNL3_9POAL|nr:Glutamine amidotransferase subunit pdxT [Rhynchospora pubera]
MEESRVERRERKRTFSRVKKRRSREESNRMSLLWEKSVGWRWLVRRTRDSKPFFFTFAALCGVIPGVVGFCVMQTTNSPSRSDHLESHLRRTARPESNMMGQVNKERLAEFLGELQRKEDTNDRYVAALRGETLTRKPYVRIQPVPNQTAVEENKTKDK